MPAAWPRPPAACARNFRRLIAWMAFAAHLLALAAFEIFSLLQNRTFASSSLP